MTHRPIHRRGFTMLELLIALTMSAGIAAGLFACMRTVLRTRTSTQAATEPPRTASLAMEMIKIDLESVVPPNGTIAGNFEGAMDNVDLFTTADSPEHVCGNGEIKEVVLRLVLGVAGSDGMSLVRQIQRNPYVTTVPPTPDEEVICRNVTSLGFRYYDGSIWQPVWDSTQNNNTLPSAVEVTLQFTRTVPGSPPRQYSYVKVIPLPCSTTTTGSNGIGSGGGLGF